MQYGPGSGSERDAQHQSTCEAASDETVTNVKLQAMGLCERVRVARPHARAHDERGRAGEAPSPDRSVQ